MVQILNCKKIRHVLKLVDWSSPVSAALTGHEYFAPLKRSSVEKNMLFCSFTNFMQLFCYYEKKINQWVLETFIVLFPSMHGLRIGATGVQYRKLTEYKTAED